MNDIYDLLPEQKGIHGIYDDRYAEKYIHDIPETVAVPREGFILELCKGKTVLHIGSNGPLNPMLEKAAKKVYAVDLDECDNNAQNFYPINIESPGCFEIFPDPDIILAADVVEHLSNPGLFLDNLEIFDCKIFISVPNAFAKTHIDWLAKNRENVHRDHVAYYSYHTLKCLVERHGFRIESWFWYNGLPRIAEGIIFIVEKTK